MLGTQEYSTQDWQAGWLAGRPLCATGDVGATTEYTRETQPPPFVATSSWSGVSDRLLTPASHRSGDQPLAPSRVVTQISRSSAKNE